MELSRGSCRLCLSETDFNVSLFGIYARKTDLRHKILFCLKLSIEETDYLTTICYKCTVKVEKYYEFATFIKKTQIQLHSKDEFKEPPSRSVKLDSLTGLNKRHLSCAREQVVDLDCTFSFLEVPEKKKEQKISSPFFSYFSPPSQKCEKSSPPKCEEKNIRKRDCRFTSRQANEVTKSNSRDLFESQSQCQDEPESYYWKLTPDDNIIKRIRQKCFGRTDF